MPATSASFAWFWGTTAILAIALYFPANRMIWVMRVRRLEKSLGREANEAEREEVRRKTRLLAGIIAVCFSFIFNKMLLQY